MTQQPDRISESDPQSEAARISANSHPVEENTWLEILKTLGLSAVLAFGIRTFVAEARYIPTGSMLPTLQINDRLMIDKIGYRFSDIQRGDIVVFKPTVQLQQEGFKEAFIKRIIGLPGDKIEIVDGRVYANGEFLDEPYVAHASDPTWDEVPGLSRGTRVDVCRTNPPYFTQKQRGDTEVWEAVVPADSYLVMGDNRNNSYDSRCWGVVERNETIGRAVVRFWPIQRVGGIDRPSYLTESK
ncbi:signal peptidase I [Oscillatoriales cyanobacterium LEGE 11467]|uniref:Signal peptidase I n=1 Tax=Zarconia navalis LEGE 11467 TaxID=1828826 RepID=A0A928VZS3_9CYAN|nr:signal peptidase I [Zarconia navalis]MBE9041326.1 signal peptidase I [Zarconia navalis LEGE 11467]